jgi:putative transcription factor
MCGKVDDNLLRTIVEGVELTVCNNCSKFGKVLGQLRRELPKPKPRYAAPQKEEVQEGIVDDYHEIIKRKRESLGISQKDFALKLSEKESIVHKLETGHFEPPLSLARKLEKMLGVKLVHKVKDEEIEGTSKKKSGDGFTLGDFIKVRK